MLEKDMLEKDMMYFVTRNVYRGTGGGGGDPTICYLRFYFPIRNNYFLL